ncbi:hypothetical protein HF324_15550 [Chitinophaga oryzae]|uniref:Adhesin domain-containing protein n=1 Tax=Chitinophaga oryzae TaxID=2725414 RepID=A0AAE6ZHD4_9BACT|nr:hypothetical protein [Chitinophaga oryzae]QJB32743.1 hypothetical protein HF329_16025 [Chitinophaga oryzae]QJB39196.1 hypothetical protein HF324_15550 [Chitinophaga oryzae]
MKLKFNLLLCLVLPLFTFATKGSVTYKKTIRKEFTVSAGTAFSLSNKYGKVVFHAWNKNEVKAVITITGFGNNDQEAQGITESVSIDAVQNGANLSLNTVYTASKSGSWFSWGNKKDSKDYVNIDYDVYIPENLSSLKVENSFGDVIADRLKFPAEMSLNYCAYDIRDAADLRLKVNYCDKGRIGKANKVVLKGNYSELKAEQLDVLNVNSNYSNYTITNLGILKIAANYDNYKIQRVEQVSGYVTFSDTNIGDLVENINMKITYGDLDIKKVVPGFKGADLVLTFSDLKLNLPRKSPLQLDFVMVNGDLNTSGLELKNVNSNKTASTQIYKAQAGGGGEGSPVIKIRGTNADARVTGY